MKTFSSAFNTAKNNKTESSPVWILKIPFVAGTVYLSDRVFTYTGITIKAWIESWGTIDEDVTNEIGQPQVSDFSVNIIINPDEATDINDLLWSESVETLDCELYLWFEGLTVATDPMVLIWSGNIIDFEKINELIYRVDLVDESQRVNKSIGRVLSLADYANAYLNDVGYTLPIIYGTVTRSPAIGMDVGKITTIIADLADDATSFTLTDGTGFSNGMTVIMDAEEILINTISGNSVSSASRAQNATTAAAHSGGCAVIEKQAICVFMFADHPVKSIDNVYMMVNDLPVDITSLCTKYTGQGGANDYTGYAGKAVVTCPGYITYAKAVEVGIVDTLVVDDDIDVTSNTNVNTQEGKWWGGGPWLQTNGNTSTKTGTYDNPDVAGSERWYEVTWGGGCSTPQANSAVVNLYTGVGGANNVLCQITNNGMISVSPSPLIVPKTTSGWFSGSCTVIAKDGTINGSVYSVSVTNVRACQYRVVNTNISKTGNANRSGNISASGDAYADVAIGNKLYITGKGYQDDGSGTFTGSASALIERPDHIFKHFLYTYASWPVADFSTDAATPFAADSYKFGVVINERRKLNDWLAYMALQCRCWFRFASGKAYLLYRTDTLSSDKTITAAMIRQNDDFTTTTRIRRSSLDEVINYIDVYYNKDWSLTGNDAYKAISSASDATSIAAYGQKDRPDVFKFDFVTDATMAADLRDFYIARYKDRKKVVTIGLFMDNSELEYADAITITPLGALDCEVRNVRVSPGSKLSIDTIELTAREY